MPEAEQVLRAEIQFTDEPINTDDIDGLNDAIQEVAETHEKQLVRTDGVQDYDVYWNPKTETVRVAAVVMGASYEVPSKFLEDTEADDE